MIAQSSRTSYSSEGRARNDIRMSSCFERRPAENYSTPPCLCAALTNNISIPDGTIWEPAVGDGVLAEHLSSSGFRVIGSDIRNDASIAGRHGVDFLTAPPPPHVSSIVTNPPMDKCGQLLTAFIARGLEHLREGRLGDDGALVLLLRLDHERAKSRTAYFNQASERVVCSWRPTWFAEKPDKKSRGPIHSFVWWAWRSNAFGLPKSVYVDKPSLMRA